MVALSPEGRENPLKICPLGIVIQVRQKVGDRHGVAVEAGKHFKRSLLHWGHGRGEGTVRCG